MRRFEFKSGTICLDLVDTVSARGSKNVDLLTSPEDITRWAKAGTLKTDLVDAVPSQQDLENIRALREAIFRAASASLKGDSPVSADVGILNDAASEGGPKAILKDDRIGFFSDCPIRAIMTEIAEDAIYLLGTDRRKRLRQCPGCNMLFFDGSPPARRKWCSSAAGCGNRSKIQRHRNRATTRQEKNEPASCRF